MRQTTRQQGFTLVEMMVSMFILSVLMLAFTQIFGGSLRASSQINSRNELVSEGQIAQQLVASRLQRAYYVYPVGQTLNLTAGGTTTKNTVRAGAVQNWKVGTDPFLALLAPPDTTGQCPAATASSSAKEAGRKSCFTFYAYYPLKRGIFITDTPSSAPDKDPNNTDAWVLMEYRVNVYDGVNRDKNQLLSPPTLAGNFDTFIKGKTGGTMLIDYVQPLGAAPYNTMFTIDPVNKFIDFNLRLQQNRMGKILTAPAGTAPLTTRVYPRNWF